MKKLFLLLATGVICTTVNAQERRASVVFTGNGIAKTAKASNKNLATANHSTLSERTTAGPGGGRWYDYVDSVLGVYDINISLVGAIAFTDIPLWNDTTAIVGFSDGSYSSNLWTSTGLSLDPFTASFNDSLTFPAEIKVTNTDPYVIDSIAIIADYSRPAIAGTYFDTLRFSLVYGNGTSTSDLPGYYFTGMSTNYGIDTLNFIDMLHDSLNNQADVTTAPGTIYSFKVPLGPNDTGANFPTIFKLPANFAVPAGKFASMSVGFKSGDPSYTPFDTVRYSDGSVKHGILHQLVGFSDNGTGSSPLFPPYAETDQNVGFFKEEGSQDGGWGGNYIPNWAYTNATTGGPFALQYPNILYHVTCAACAWTTYVPLGVAKVENTSTVSAYPNPATSELNISFNLSQNANVSVSLTNMVGQVVATKNIDNVNNGKAVFNTSALPAGMYMYTLQANGQRTTGRVVVAH